MTTRRRRSIFDIIEEYFQNLEERAEKFREALVEKPSWNRRASTIEPLRNVMITPTEVIVTLDLPYAEENTIQVKPINNDTIEILAKLKQKVKLCDLGITHYKGEFQTFHCQTPIPVSVHMDRMEIRFKKGILEIHLPRKHEYETSVE